MSFMLIALSWAGIVPDATPAAIVVYGTTKQNDAQTIAGMIAQQYSAANGRNFDAYMAAFWRSPLLVYVIEGAVWTGWDAVRAHLEREYPAPSAMGHAVLERLQTNFVDPETAITVEYWTVYFLASRVHGVSIGNWRKLPEGWRMVQASTNSTETP